MCIRAIYPPLRILRMYLTSKGLSAKPTRSLVVGCECLPPASYYVWQVAGRELR